MATPGPSPKQVVAECFRAFAARDVDAFLGFVHPEVVWQPASALFAPDDARASVYHGHEGIRRWFADVAGWTGYSVRTLSFDDSGDYVFVPAVATLAIDATWLTRAVYYVFGVRDGRVVALASWAREDEARQQAGLPPRHAALGAGAIGGGELKMPAEAAQVGRVRAMLRETADAVGMDAAQAYDLLVAVTEAIGNALVHGEADSENRIDVRWGVEDDMLVVCVGDCGRYSAADTLEPERADHGRGIGVMRLLVDDMTIEARDDGTRVRLAKRLVPV